MRLPLCTLIFSCFIASLPAQGGALDRLAQDILDSLVTKIEKAEEDVEQARQKYRDTVQKAVDKAIKGLKRRVKFTPDHIEQAAIYKTILRLDATDEKAGKFFASVGNLDRVMADLAPPIVRRDSLGRPAPAIVVAIPSHPVVHVSFDEDNPAATGYSAKTSKGKKIPLKEEGPVEKVRGVRGAAIMLDGTAGLTAEMPHLPQGKTPRTTAV